MSSVSRVDSSECAMLKSMGAEVTSPRLHTAYMERLRTRPPPHDEPSRQGEEASFRRTRSGAVGLGSFVLLISTQK